MFEGFTRTEIETSGARIVTMHVENNTVYANPADRSRFLEGLRKAGLKN